MCYFEQDHIYATSYSLLGDNNMQTNQKIKRLNFTFIAATFSGHQYTDNDENDEKQY